VIALALPLASRALASASSSGEVLSVGGASTVTLTGHGFGHGRGMGQYGALGYALNENWTYEQILNHFYGDTVEATAPPGTIMTVDMTAEDGQQTIVAQSNGMLTVPSVAAVKCATGAPCAVRLARTGSQTWQVSQSTACNGGPTGWKVVASNVIGASVPVTSTAETTQDPADMLELCEAAGTQWLRGDIWAVDTGSGQATVNHLPLESYVQGVVPNESPTSWGSLGGGAGEQALMAQAVAARSYALADNYNAYAKTCDTTTCQVYGGRGFQPNGGSFTDREGTATFANSDQATAATAGEIRDFASGGGGAAGTVALTEFSSSTGGYSAGGRFPAVVDAGDSVSDNPNHTWSLQIPVASIESTYGAGMGPLTSLDVTSRNGYGDLGGRVLSLTMNFANGSATDTGNGFAASFGLLSNWFAFVSAGAASGGSAGSPPPPAPTAPAGPVTVGYHVLTGNGTVTPFNGAPMYGSLNAASLGLNAVSLGETPGGYDMLVSNGGVYAFGAANWFGSLRGKGLNAPPFELTTTPDGNGYWILASDGGVFSFGDAAFHGSTGGMRLNKPIVGMATTPDGGGYWLVASDGGIFCFGDAQFHGSTGSMHLTVPIVSMTPTPDGGGYWLLDADGGIYTFGDAAYEGSLPSIHVAQHAAAFTAVSTAGYLVATTGGDIYGFNTVAGGRAGGGAPAVDSAGSEPVAITPARS